MFRKDKEKMLSGLQDTFGQYSSAVVMHNHGLTVSEITELRNTVRENGGVLKVTKNRVAKIAINGTAFEGLSDYLSGPTVVAVSNDPVSVAKDASKFSKENDRLKIICGSIDSKIIDAKGVGALAKLPSLDGVRASFLGLLNTPATQLASVLQATASGMVRVIGAYSEKKDAE